MPFLRRIANFILLNLISLYQKTLSFDHGPLRFFFPYGYCRFRPTCSEYAQKAIHKHGPIKGVAMALKRIVRCNPFHPGGWDPA